MKIPINASGLREPLATPKNPWGSRYFVRQGFEGFWSNFIENEWALLTGKKQVRALEGYNTVRVSFSTARSFTDPLRSDLLETILNFCQFANSHPFTDPLRSDLLETSDQDHYIKALEAFHRSFAIGLIGNFDLRVHFDMSVHFHRSFAIGLIGNHCLSCQRLGGQILSPILCDRTYWKPWW